MIKLSKNEKKVLNLLYKGYRNKEISTMMFTKTGKQLSEKTVAEYTLRVRKKLNVSSDKNLYFLIAEALKSGVITKLNIES